MNSLKKRRVGFVVSLIIHLLIAYYFKALYPRSYITNLILTSALLGSIMGISAVYGPGKGFITSVLTYVLHITHGIYIQKVEFIQSVTINMKLFVSNIIVSILVGSLTSSLNIGSILLWSFLSQILSEILVNIAEISMNPIYCIFVMLPYNSPVYILNSFASLTYSFIYLSLLITLAKERPRKA